MSENKRLVPVCIIYVDGNRLDTACEGAFRSLKVFDLLNKISECSIAFDWSDLGNENAKAFPFSASLSVHLGYKDDTNETFSGEITGRKILHAEYGPSLYTVTASSPLHRLERARHRRRFENKTPSQAIGDILQLHGLQVDCDSFGPQKPYWDGGEQTDWDLILGLAKRYGKDVCCIGEKVYVKEQMTMRQEEAVYEWGKSLADFRAGMDIEGAAGSIQAMGWDITKAKGFRATKSLDDLGQKTGGGSPWTKVAKSGKGWRHTVLDNGLSDEEEAGELALGLLREQSYKFMRAEGSGEGNAELGAGAIVTVKGAGLAYSGEYIAEAVIHEFSLEGGFTTGFRLKRNMLDDEYAKKMSGGGAGQSAGKGGAGASSQTDSEDEEDDEDEEEEGPEFRRLLWKKDGSEVSEALIDDEVTLFCEVKNIDEGETVKLYIYEHDEDGEHDDICELEGTVKDGKAEVPWKVEYHEDNDDSESSCAEEIEKYGYTVPEYFFIAEYNGTESNEEECGLLNTKVKMEQQLKNEDTGEIWANRKYTLFLPDDTEIEGMTDEDGYIEPTPSAIGDVYFLIYKEEDANGN